jgi:hypothetical protein
MKSVRIPALFVSLAMMSAVAMAAQPAPVPAPAPAAVTENPSETTVKWKLDAVTVYRGQALVTRTVDLPAGSGLAELLVQDLPERILGGSLFAEGSDGVDVRSVRYRERAQPTDVREEARKLDQQIQDLNDKIAANQKQMQVLGEQRAYLDKLANFAAPTATTEMTKGVLNAEQLKTLTDYQFSSRQKIADNELKLQQEARTLNEQANFLGRQKAEMVGRSSKTQREAVIFISRERPGGSLRVRYLVDSATWSPSYNVRADADKKTATLEYLASIAQRTGEDWKDVTMTLSTASPNLVAAAPTLASLQIALTSGGARGGAGGLGSAIVGGVDLSSVDYGAVQRNFDVQRQNVFNNRALNGNSMVANNSAPVQGFEQQRAQQDANDKALIRLADQQQFMELLTKDSKVETRRASSSAEGVVVTYQLKTRTSLPSREDRQLIQIDQLALKSNFYKIAIPVLTSYVYDEADLTNTSAAVLLAGPVSSYVGGQFVGSDTIDTVAVGQPFTVGFGIDSSLHTTRERVEKSDQTQGGNRVVNYVYRLAIENFGSKPAAVRLMDRLPLGKESEVRIVFDDAEGVKVSPDKEYQQTERKKGILRWDVEVPPQKSGSEAFALQYKLHLEYDKNLAISTTGLLGPELDQLLKQ